MILFHGSDKEFEYLKANSCITKNFKDACKFGYRKAVLSNSHFVYIYIIEIQDEKDEKDLLKKDEKRDRAFITLQKMKVEIKSKYPTYQTPYKLKKFKLD